MEIVRLNTLASGITDTHDPGLEEPILTLSSEQGIVDQSTYFGKRVAGENTERYTRIRENDFVYNDRITARSRYGTIRRLEGIKSGIVSPIYKCFRLHDEDAAAFYDFYFQTGKHDEEIRALVNEGARAGRYNLTINQFLSTRVPKVGPKERRRVAGCLESLDELVAAAAEKLEAVKRHKKGLLQQLFPIEGETIPRLRFPQFENADPWQPGFLSDLSTVVRGGSPRPIDDFITEESDGLNWLKIGDVDAEAKYIARTSQKVLKSALSKTRTISPGDLILSNSMSFGRPYISKIDSCIHDGWLAVTKLHADLLNEFAYYLLLSERSQTYFTSAAAGSGVQNLNLERVSQLPISWPTIEEQSAILQALSALDALVAQASGRLALLRTHKGALMQQVLPTLDEREP